MKIRILVAIDAKGSWECQGGGWNGKPTKERELFYELAQWQAYAAPPGTVHHVWVEADVPLPAAPKRVRGKARPTRAPRAP